MADFNDDDIPFASDAEYLVHEMEAAQRRADDLEREIESMQKARPNLQGMRMDSILNLQGVKILKIEENNHDLRIHIDYPADMAGEMCMECGLIGEVSRFGKIEQTIMDLPIHAKRVGLVFRSQRLKCKNCGHTFMQHLAFIDERRQATLRLVDYIERESLRRTFTNIADEVGVSEGTVRNIFKAYAQRLDETVHFETPEWLGLDELHLLRKPRGIVTNVQERTVIELLPNRNKPTIAHYLARLPNKGKVKLVAMDMWNPYREAVQASLPHSQIVVDKFHIVRMANSCLEDIRKSIRKGLPDNQRRTLMHDRFVLLHRRADLDAKSILKLTAWTGAFPILGQAYELKESFFGIWDTADVADARRLYTEWKASIPAELTLGFKPVVTAMTNWETEIFNYFEVASVTNAYTEAVNGLTKLVNRTGRGYSFPVIRAKLLYSSGFKKIPKPKFEKSSDIRSFKMSSSFMTGVDKPEELNLGSEISTLTEKLNNGTL